MEKTEQELLNTFENLNIIITGFTKTDLTTTGLLNAYFNTIKEKMCNNFFTNLLVSFFKIKTTNLHKLSAAGHSCISELIHCKPYENLINHIIQLWYLEEWISNSSNEENQIIPSESYLEALIWKAISAHPMGGKQPGYGTWGFLPLIFSSKTS